MGDPYNTKDYCVLCNAYHWTDEPCPKDLERSFIQAIRWHGVEWAKKMIEEEQTKMAHEAQEERRKIEANRVLVIQAAIQRNNEETKKLEKELENLTANSNKNSA